MVLGRRRSQFLRLFACQRDAAWLFPVMQTPTHMLGGVLIQKAFDWKQHRHLALGLTAACAFLSQGLLDKLANLTYHRANPDFQSPIWVGLVNDS